MDDIEGFVSSPSLPDSDWDKVLQILTAFKLRGGKSNRTALGRLMRKLDTVMTEEINALQRSKNPRNATQAVGLVIAAMTAETMRFTLWREAIVRTFQFMMSQRGLELIAQDGAYLVRDTRDNTYCLQGGWAPEPLWAEAFATGEEAWLAAVSYTPHHIEASASS